MREIEDVLSWALSNFSTDFDVHKKTVSIMFIYVHLQTKYMCIIPLFFRFSWKTLFLFWCKNYRLYWKLNMKRKRIWEKFQECFNDTSFLIPWWLSWEKLSIFQFKQFSLAVSFMDFNFYQKKSIIPTTRQSITNSGPSLYRYNNKLLVFSIFTYKGLGAAVLIVKRTPTTIWDLCRYI